MLQEEDQHAGPRVTKRGLRGSSLFNDAQSHLDEGNFEVRVTFQTVVGVSRTVRRSRRCNERVREIKALRCLCVSLPAAFKQVYVQLPYVSSL